MGGMVGYSLSEGGAEGRKGGHVKTRSCCFIHSTRLLLFVDPSPPSGRGGGGGRVPLQSVQPPPHFLGFLQPFPPSNSPNVLFTIFYYLPPKDSSPYNSFSPTIPLISIPHIYYHSLINYLFNVFEFKKIIQYLYCHNTHYHHVTMLKRINIAKKQCD